MNRVKNFVDMTLGIGLEVLFACGIILAAFLASGTPISAIVHSA
mgnify:CR=1 FL=1